MDDLGEDGPPQRKRVSKACDRCRRRKDKCDGKRPVCGTCEQSSAACSWNPLSKKRGLPDGYVRGLERICGAVIREIPGIEDLLLDKFSGDEEALYDYWADDGHSDSPLELWKKSRLVKELDRLLPILDSLTKKGKKRTWEDSEGLASNHNVVSSPKPIQNATVPIIKEDEPLIAVVPESKPTESLAPLVGPSDSLSSSNDWTLPSSAGRLVEAYFSYTHSWFPIIERHDLLRVLYQGPKSKVTRSPGENAALWAVLAYSEVQYNMISASNQIDCSDSSEDLFYNRAKSLIPIVDGDYELGHAQSCLILAVLKVGKEDWKSAWILVGHAIRVAMNLGLDLMPPNAELSKLSTIERRRKHVFLGCFVLDTIIAARLGRSSHLRSQDVEEIGTLDEEGLEEWDHWNDCLRIRRSTSASLYQATTLSTFNNFVQLLRILSDIICFNPAQKSNSNGDLLGLNNDINVNNSVTIFYNETVARLDSWKASHGAIDENLALPSRCNLYLTHLSIIMTLNLRYPSDTPLIHLGKTTIQWLELYSENFNLQVLPPIFEYSLKLARDCIAHSLHTNNPETCSSINWIEPWQQVSTSLSESWPVFQLSISPPNTNLTILHKQPTLLGILEISSTQQQQQESGSAPMPSTAPSLAQTAADNWQVSQLATPRVFIETTPHSFHSPSVPSAIQPSQSQSQPQSQFRDERVSPLLGQDSIFQEVYDMDANLWSNTWEQSLLNLGFTNGGQNMDEEFYSFFGGGGGGIGGGGDGSQVDKFGLFEQPLGIVGAQGGALNADVNVGAAGGAGTFKAKS